MDNKKIECPYCCETIPAKALKCKHCLIDLFQINESNNNQQDIEAQAMPIAEVTLSNANESIKLLGVNILKRSRNKPLLTGVVLFSIAIIFGLAISLSSCTEMSELRKLQSSQRSLSGQISRLRDARMDLEGERNSIQRLINEHERISSYNQLSSFDESRLIEISNDLLSYSRYINYRIGSSGVIVAPTLNDQLDNQIKEVRLQELELEKELAFVEFELNMKELKQW